MWLNDQDLASSYNDYRNAILSHYLSTHEDVLSFDDWLAREVSNDNIFYDCLAELYFSETEDL